MIPYLFITFCPVIHMEKYQFPFSREHALFVQSIFNLAKINKETDSFEVLINGLPFCLQPSDDVKQIESAVSRFNTELHTRLNIRFYYKHRIVRDYEFTNQPVAPAPEPMPSAEEILGAYGKPQPDQEPRSALVAYDQINALVAETGMLLGAAIGALDSLATSSLFTAELADTRGKLLDVYEERIARQQEELERYRKDFGKFNSKSSRPIRAFNGERCAGVIVDKAVLQQQLSPLLELFKFLTGQQFGDQKKQNPKS